MTELSADQVDGLLRRPFDHYARYKLAAEVVTATAGPRARVLDLGGGPGSLQAFLPEARVTSTDLFLPSGWHEQAPSLVLADGAALPFADDAFDVVVSLDTLEHVRPHARTAFLEEVARVTARWALVVCPYGTPGVADADIALRAYVTNRFAPDLPTIGILDEHIGFGHPDLEASRAVLAAHGPVATIPSGRLDRWLAGMIAFFHLLALGDDEPVEVVQRFLNRNLYEADLAGPAYRHGLLLRTGEGSAGEGAADEHLTPEAVIEPLLARAAAHPAAGADLDLLRIVLTESLVASTREAVADAAAARQRQGVLEEENRRLAEALAQSEAHAHQQARARTVDAEAYEALVRSHDELVGFRDAVMTHPLVRVRRMAKRLLGRT